MLRLIISIFFLVILAVLIALNLGHNTSFNFYGLKLQEIPVMVIAILSFVVGVLYSFVYYFSNYLAKMSKNRIKKKGMLVKTREMELEEKEEELKIMNNSHQPAQEQKTVTSKNKRAEVRKR